MNGGVSQPRSLIVPRTLLGLHLRLTRVNTTNLVLKGRCANCPMPRLDIAISVIEYFLLSFCHSSRRRPIMASLGMCSRKFVMSLMNIEVFYPIHSSPTAPPLQASIRPPFHNLGQFSVIKFKRDATPEEKAAGRKSPGWREGRFLRVMGPIH